MANSLSDTIFQKGVEAGASDVHITVGSPLLFRIDGELLPQTENDITPADAEKFVKATLQDFSFKRLQENREVDVSYQLPNGVRLRVNCHFERGFHGLVARVIPTDIPTLEEIGLENIIPRFTQHREGLILFTGPTGMGKSTSLASMIQYINDTKAESIVTLEDPIEFLFPRGKGLIRQRQLGQDFLSFAEALKRVLRQDPNIVMVGEMRDPETFSAALTLAETGHLILGTLHTPNTIQAIDRMIDVFPPYQQPQIRSQLSMSLKAIVAQRLLPRIGGGRTAHREILINTQAASNTIRDNRLAELKSVLQTGTELGMVSFEKDAKRLYKENIISKEVYEAALVQ